MDSQQISVKRQIAVIAGLIAFLVMVLDALNGFAGLLAVQPFATKRYVADVVVDQAAKTADALAVQVKATLATNEDIQTRLVNLQLMSLEINIALIDGQIVARKGEMVDLTISLKSNPNDLLLQRRKSELEDVIEKLAAREVILQCYLDTLRGLKRDCR